MMKCAVVLLALVAVALCEDYEQVRLLKDFPNFLYFYKGFLNYSSNLGF